MRSRSTTTLPSWAPPTLLGPSTTATPANPPFGTTYYWRVRGKSAQGVPTQYSVPRAYSMVWQDATGSTAPSVDGAKPTLLSPPNTTSSTIEEIGLDWAPLRGASAYELQISPDQFFNAPIGGTRLVNSTAFSPSPTLPAGSYYWRVRGLSTSKPAEPGPWSDPWVFTRAWPASNADTRPRGTADNRHDQVKLLLPADGHYASPNTPLAEPASVAAPARGLPLRNTGGKRHQLLPQHVLHLCDQPHGRVAL